MSVSANIFGVSYLTAEEFKASAELFGAGMSLADYPQASDDKLNRALQAASRMIDSFCGKTFTPDAITEQHPFDPSTWQFRVNNGPVVAVSACTIVLRVGQTVNVDTSRLYINNQARYIEISQDYFQTVIISNLLAPLVNPVIQVTYTSLASVPQVVRLACGYQCAALLSRGFVDKIMPADFGTLDFGGLSINNRRGGKSAEELEDTVLVETAKVLLRSYVQYVAG